MTDDRTDQTNGTGDGASRESEGKLVDPGLLDFKKAEKAFEKIVRENREWLKEMASR